MLPIIALLVASVSALPSCSLRDFVRIDQADASISGSQSSVYLAYHRHDQRRTLHLVKRPLFKDDFEAEHTILSLLANHPNIVQAVCVDQRKQALVLEYMPDGDVSELEHHRGARRALAEKLPEMTWQLVSALAAIHSKRMLHMDIKPENILRDGSVLKLADFGLASEFGYAQAQTGTVQTMAPEVLSETRQRITAAADWWSLGVSLYYLHSVVLCERVDHYPYRVLGKGLGNGMEWQPSVPLCLPDKFVDLLVLLFAEEPEARDFSKADRMLELESHAYFV